MSSPGSSSLEMFVKLHCLLHKKSICEFTPYSPTYLVTWETASEEIMNVIAIPVKDADTDSYRLT